MKIVAVVISVLALLSQWQAQAQGSSERVKVYISCSTIPEGGMNTYFTDIFTVELTRHLRSKGWVYEDLSPFPLQQAYASFLEYLTSKGYKFKPTNSAQAQCDFDPDENVARTAKHRRAYEGSPCSNCGKVIETGWKPAATTATDFSTPSRETGNEVSSAGSPPIQASYAPSRGTMVRVRMIDAVDSNNNSPGHQYRATVTTAVDNGNGNAIPEGSTAIVKLAQTSSGWTAQLASVIVKDQTVQVNSSAATLTSSAQSSASNSINTVTSTLGNFGLGRQRNNSPAAAAVVSGQRVILPPGTQLQFVVGENSAASSSESVTQTALRTRDNNSERTASAVSSPSGNRQMQYYYCEAFPNQGKKTVYFSPVFPSDADYPAILKAWLKYMDENYKPANQPPMGGQCPVGATAAEMQDIRARFVSRSNVVELDWKYNAELSPADKGR